MGVLDVNFSVRYPFDLQFIQIRCMSSFKDTFPTEYV